MSEAVIDEVVSGTGGEPAKAGTPNGLSSESLARSLAKELRAPSGSAKNKESSGGAGPKPGTMESAEGSTAKVSGKDSSPDDAAGAHAARAPLGEPPEGGSSRNATGGENLIEDGAGDGDGSGTGGKEAWPKAAVDTVTGLRAERRELKAKLEALEKTAAGTSESKSKNQESGASAETGTGRPRSEGAGGAVDLVPKELVEEEGTKRQLISWAREATRRLRTDPDSVLAELDKHGVRLADRSPEGVADWLGEVRENATTELARVGAQIELARGQASQQKEFEKAQAVQVAHEYMPELAEADSPRRQRFEQIMKTHPELESHPRGPLAAMVQVLGMEALDALMAQKKGNGDGKGGRGLPQSKTLREETRPPAKLPNGSGPAPVVANGKRVSSSDLLKVYQKSGLESDKIAWVRATLG